MMNILVMIALCLLACVGLVQTASWIAVRLGNKQGRVYRVFPIGGEGKNPGRQMARMYSCLQWESNPSRQVYVLYDMGLDDQAVKDCKELSESAGVAFVRSPHQLDRLMRGEELLEEAWPRCCAAMC